MSLLRWLTGLLQPTVPRYGHPVVGIASEPVADDRAREVLIPVALVLDDRAVGRVVQQAAVAADQARPPAGPLAEAEGQIDPASLNPASASYRSRPLRAAFAASMPK